MDAQVSDPIVIVGAGPAGMMLAYQLASNGLPVRVFERHKDFSREFRGEFAQPSLLEALEQLGILSALRGGGRVVAMSAGRMHHRGRAFASNVGENGAPAGYAVHQPSLLALLHAECGRFPRYALTTGAAVTGLVQKDGRVRGVVAKIDGREEPIAARLVVVCNGRASALRKQVGLEADNLQAPHNLLWLRFDLAKRPELCPDVLEGFVTKNAFCVLYPTYGHQAQLMWQRNRKHPLDWKASIATLKPELLADTPSKWHPIFEAAMNDETERQVLNVLCDRLRRWWSPGVMFLGDAAHTMSAIGGQGLTIAVRDAIVAANHLVRAHREGAELGDALCERIEAERRPEVEKMQAFQVRAGRISNAPPPAQWLMAKIIIPLATKLQGASYLREVQHGVTNVKVEFPVPVSSQERRAASRRSG
jgi:2-polyprenyl-6-methoxyphenol hydroxylase-like FAD-dependent oxidoreductase